MKKEIHPTYYAEAKVTCSGCGNTFTTGSTMPEIHVEVCSNCHPFYTGSAKFVDTEGRVEKFQRHKKEAEAVKVATAKKVGEKKIPKEERPQTLREMMELIQKGQ